MPRLNVDAADYFSVLATIPDVNAVDVLPADQANIQASPGYVAGGLRLAPFPIPVGKTATLGNSPLIANVDTVPHDFLYFLSGPNVPGARVQLNTVPQTIVNGTTGAVPFLPILTPGQALEVEMQEAVVTTAPNLSALWARWLDRPLAVAGYQLGSQVDVVDSVTPSVLTAGAVRRMPLSAGLLSSQLINRDTVAHAITFSGPGPLPVNNDAALAADGRLGPGGTVLLAPTETITAATATATTATDPLMWWVYADLET